MSVEDTYSEHDVSQLSDLTELVLPWNLGDGGQFSLW